MSVMLLLILVFLMSLIQITIFKSMPKVVQKLFAWSIPLALVCNFFISAAIAAFTGVGAIIGVANLAGSVVFGVYLAGYRSYHKISGASIKHNWFIPYVSVREGNPTKNFFF